MANDLVFNKAAQQHRVKYAEPLNWHETWTFACVHHLCQDPEPLPYATLTVCCNVVEWHMTFVQQSNTSAQSTATSVRESSRSPTRLRAYKLITSMHVAEPLSWHESWTLLVSITCAQTQSLCHMLLLLCAVMWPSR